MATAAQVIAKAKSQDGVHEIGYTNKVKYNDWFYGGRSKYGSWAAWCAAFTSWVFDQLGLRAGIDYPKSAGVAICRDWYRDHGRAIPVRKMKRGDQYGFKAFSHTGLHDRYSTGKTYSYGWEGNTSPGNSGSQRDGGGVHYRKRAVSTLAWAGRPNLAGGKTPATNMTKKKGVFGMTLKAQDNRTEKRTIGKGKEIVLHTHKKNTNSYLCSVKKGETIAVSARGKVSGLREGQVAEAWIRIGEYVKKTKTSHVNYNYSPVTIHGRADGKAVGYHLGVIDKIGTGPKHGGELRLYIVVKNITADQAATEYIQYSVLGD
ncbi:hypothetical protein NQ036_06740 [Brevibacterium sp. 91QC2O2]|uniref:hypothetical protein n=1 Tax=Brevibacterium sp. 91QC2O2 TaxID=2968458 RepID=UPI00211C5248|nr:hypothetical protein [Brevibacterium sp. 91QC2O2]MCQ9367940.1 hypothetical protein [Brevibacterium sp. 91QC2O2]